MTSDRQRSVRCGLAWVSRYLHGKPWDRTRTEVARASLGVPYDLMAVRPVRVNGL